MNLTNPEELAALLKKFGFHTQKKLGQNFLVCEKTLQTIIEAAGIQENDEILEIGPGPGALTQEILKSSAKKIDALEVDAKIIPVLEYVIKSDQLSQSGDGLSKEILRQAQDDRVFIHNISALEYFPKISNYLLIANIPYYLTSPILRHYLAGEKKPKRVVLLVQKEVAEKICCKDSDQSILSLQVALYGKAEIVSFVKKEQFFPAPKVDSAIIKIEMFESCLIPEDKLKGFWKITKHAFAQKRKKIGNTLGKAFDIPFEELGIDTNRRPQTLSIKEWRSLL
ncbi:ribosomal RNA small subunit methyltransferase A [Candidatus Peregrinibacteria bacterium]|jgi:16S rRNA (adenine1518-N6/adenine1519-N6)-dimethyltransferase|nr:ribosomal RNA small subunit methyltransferase A [Candidatus Peregrinibacteria bacterium]